MSKTGQKVTLCTCGVNVYPNKRYRGHLCERCAEVERHSFLRQKRLDELSDKKSEVRAWYKYICKQDLYEVSVRVKGEITLGEWNQVVQPRLVLEITPYKYTSCKTIEDGPLKGTTYPSTITIDGYARLRTDRLLLWPKCGKAGIPHPTLSGASKDFQRVLSNNRRIERERLKEIQQKKDDEKYEKWSHDYEDRKYTWQMAQAAMMEGAKLVRKFNRDESSRLRKEEKELLKLQRRRKWEAWKIEKAKESAAKSRMNAAKKGTKTFFQMQSASQSISEYAKTTNQETT